MKKLILVAAAATMIAAPAYAAPGDRNARNDRVKVQKVQKQLQRAHRAQARTVYRQPVQVRNVYRPQVQVRNVYRQPVQAQRKWARGQRFDHRYAANYRVVDNYRAYNLNAPPYGYRYVQSNNDVVLVAIASGIIGAVFGNLL